MNNTNEDCTAMETVDTPTVTVDGKVPDQNSLVVVESDNKGDEKLKTYTKKERHNLFFSLLMQMLNEIYDVYPDMPGILSYRVFLSEKKMLNTKKKSAVKLFDSFFKENKGLIETRDVSQFRNKMVRYSDNSFIDFETILKQEPTPENPIYDYLANMERILNLSDNSPQTLRLISKLKDESSEVDLNELPQVIGNIVNEFKDMKEINIANITGKLLNSKNTKKLFDVMKKVTSGLSGDDTSDNKSSLDMNSLISSLGAIASSFKNQNS